MYEPLGLADAHVTWKINTPKTKVDQQYVPKINAIILKSLGQKIQ